MDDPTTDTIAADRAAEDGIGWTLILALALAVCLAIGLAIQLDSPGEPPRATPACGGLFDDCCQEWDDNWGPCIEQCDEDYLDGDYADRGDREIRAGLFDAEENFAERRLPTRC